MPLEEGSSISLPSMPSLGSNDLPSFLFDTGLYAALKNLLVNQLSNFQDANWLLCNTFDKLEAEVGSIIHTCYKYRFLGHATKFYNIYICIIYELITLRISYEISTRTYAVVTLNKNLLSFFQCFFWWNHSCSVILYETLINHMLSRFLFYFLLKSPK